MLVFISIHSSPSFDWLYRIQNARNRPEKNNYMNKNTFIFNKYKTAKVYGKQTIDIPIQLRNILNKWNRLTENNYLLFDKAGNKLTNVKLNQRLKDILGNNSSVNAIRHSVLSEMFQPDIELQNKMIYKNVKNVYHCLYLTICGWLGREPWSSSYGRRLMFWRAWVWIPAPYTGWTSFHIQL